MQVNTLNISSYENNMDGTIAKNGTIHYLCSMAPNIFLAASGNHSDCK